jgi:hypothetical protein
VWEHKALTRMVAAARQGGLERACDSKLTLVWVIPRHKLWQCLGVKREGQGALTRMSTVAWHRGMECCVVS